jgi:hypothetical protein
MFLTIRKHLLVICSIESIPESLPAAEAFALCSTNFSLSNVFWQYWQYQSPLGTVGIEAHPTKVIKLSIKMDLGRSVVWKSSRGNLNQ